jgi:hypothetical protein
VPNKIKDFLLDGKNPNIGSQEVKMVRVHADHILTQPVLKDLKIPSGEGITIITVPDENGKRTNVKGVGQMKGTYREYKNDKLPLHKIFGATARQSFKNTFCSSSPENAQSRIQVHENYNLAIDQQEKQIEKWVEKSLELPPEFSCLVFDTNVLINSITRDSHNIKRLAFKADYTPEIIIFLQDFTAKCKHVRAAQTHLNSTAYQFLEQNLDLATIELRHACDYFYQVRKSTLTVNDKKQYQRAISAIPSIRQATKSADPDLDYLQVRRENWKLNVWLGPRG